MNLTTNFKIEEFQCRGEKIPDKYIDNILRLAIELQKVRDIIKKPIIITSGYRCVKHNKLAGGAKNSYHLYGLAVDSHAKGMDLEEYMTYLIKFTKFNGFKLGSELVQGKYLVHADMRDTFNYLGRY